MLNSLLRRSGLFDAFVTLFPSGAVATWGMPALAVLAWAALAFALNRKEIYVRA
ncbi:hypothetical protein [Ornithinimicrobium sp. INDO-MA30-4]|uniref:hypothetical protein n=1 Tax=Ornithinimicrobium sp. INDO-MA30-4 TaxID=2908651 RepID=UPI001F206CC0|nr:hypothetical protein [Ornithinimicrobium sp. INDO-MA30-4]UJH69698.1 hypothetical protein L0A91_10235 [Ornithinimicrobium sp. INDO-MA30-4]